MSVRCGSRVTGSGFVVMTTCFVLLSSAVGPSTGNRFPPVSQLLAPKLFFNEDRDGEVVRAVVGENVVLECEASGIPAPTIHWLHHGRRIIQGNSRDVLDDEAVYEDTENNRHRAKSMKLGSTKSRLFIDCAKQSDAGQYICVAETPTKRIVSKTNLEVGFSRRKHKRFNRRGFLNSALSHKRSGEEGSNAVGNGFAASGCIRKRRVEALPARIYMWSVQRMDLEGADVQLYCRADGRPAPTVTWYDVDDRPIGANDHQYEVLPNGDLLIHEVNWHANMGGYRCAVNNTAGSDATQTFLYATTED